MGGNIIKMKLAPIGLVVLAMPGLPFDHELTPVTL
jgi:hypothetical protein